MNAMACACGLVLVLLGTTRPLTVQLTACSEDQRSALREAATLVDAFDDRAAIERTRKAEGSARSQRTPGCHELALARVAVEGWAEGRSLAAIGGDRDSLGNVNRVLRELDTSFTVEDYARPPLALAVSYAVAVTRAAVAAAQDEREEMRTYLAYAAEVAARWSPADGRLWPMSIDMVTGELTLEVDQYEDARAAFERALPTAAVQRALIGLARTLDRLGNQPAACDAYGKTDPSGLPATIRTEVANYLARPACR